jgi:hypothetical protein
VPTDIREFADVIAHHTQHAAPGKTYVYHDYEGGVAYLMRRPENGMPNFLGVCTISHEAIGRYVTEDKYCPGPSGTALYEYTATGDVVEHPILGVCQSPGYTSRSEVGKTLRYFRGKHVESLTHSAKFAFHNHRSLVALAEHVEAWLCSPA